MFQCGCDCVQPRLVKVELNDDWVTGFVVGDKTRIRGGVEGTVDDPRLSYSQTGVVGRGRCGGIRAVGSTVWHDSVP